jgi:hypothetical protein
MTIMMNQYIYGGIKRREAPKRRTQVRGYMRNYNNGFDYRYDYSPHFNPDYNERKEFLITRTIIKNRLISMYGFEHVINHIEQDIEHVYDTELLYELDFISGFRDNVERAPLLRKFLYDKLQTHIEAFQKKGFDDIVKFLTRMQSYYGDQSQDGGVNVNPINPINPNITPW